MNIYYVYINPHIRDAGMAIESTLSGVNTYVYTSESSDAMGGVWWVWMWLIYIIRLYYICSSPTPSGDRSEGL